MPEERKSVFSINKPKSDFYETVCLRFSSFSNLQGIISYCRCFCHNLRNPSSKKVGALTAQELHSAEMPIIAIVQNTSFYDEIQQLKSQGKISYNKSIKPLSPILDSNYLIRVGGRLENAELSFDEKHPLLLPSKNHITRLLIKREHIKVLHAGAQKSLPI